MYIALRVSQAMMDYVNGDFKNGDTAEKVADEVKEEIEKRLKEKNDNNG